MRCTEVHQKFTIHLYIVSLINFRFMHFNVFLCALLKWIFFFTDWRTQKNRTIPLKMIAILSTIIHEPLFFLFSSSLLKLLWFDFSLKRKNRFHCKSFNMTNEKLIYHFYRSNLVNKPVILSQFNSIFLEY